MEGVVWYKVGVEGVVWYKVGACLPIPYACLHNLLRILLLHMIEQDLLEPEVCASARRQAHTHTHTHTHTHDTHTHTHTTHTHTLFHSTARTVLYKVCTQYVTTVCCDVIGGVAYCTHRPNYLQLGFLIEVEDASTEVMELH